MRSFNLNNEMVFAAAFSDPATQQSVDPTSVALELRDPHGTVSPVTVGRVSTGNYRGMFTPSVPGIWSIRWQGLGAVMAATEYQFEIRPSAFGGQPA